MMKYFSVILLLTLLSYKAYAGSTLTKYQKTKIVTLTEWNLNITLSKKKSKTIPLRLPKAVIETNKGELFERRSTSKSKLKIKIKRRCDEKGSGFNCDDSYGG